jgi:hypothetical protein
VRLFHIARQIVRQPVIARATRSRRSFPAARCTVAIRREEERVMVELKPS